MSSPQYYAWLLAKSKKEIKRRTKKRKRYLKAVEYRKQKNIVKRETKHARPIKIFQAPKNFSIINNPEETNKFFNSVIDVLNSRTFKMLFVFDLKEIELITIDAIMYLIALIKNGKASGVYQYSFWGNEPSNLEARTIFQNSGFYSYVKNYRKDIQPTDDRIMIKTGVDSNPILASELCNFAMRNISCSNIKRKRLYETFIELMTNTLQHAYNNSSFISKNWYVYAERSLGRIKYIFLDTGEGISSTIYKKLGERIRLLLGESDEKYIKSAFVGDKLRSETRKAYRGEGLTNIYKHAKSNILSEFTVISGNGVCKFTNEYDKIWHNNENIEGTLYYWEIKTEMEDQYEH